MEPRPRRTSPPITGTIDALVRVTFVDSLDNFGGNVSRLGRLVFFRDLVQTRFGRGAALPLSPPLEPLLRVLLLECDVDRLLQSFGHVFLSVLYSHNFGESFELVLEIPIGEKNEN